MPLFTQRTLGDDYLRGTSAPQVVALDATRGAVEVRDNVAPIGGVLWSVSNSNSSVDYLAVTASGIDVVGVGTVTKNAVGTAQTAGWSLINTTAAAAGAQQYSSALKFTAQGWKTNATAGSRQCDGMIQMVTVQGTANPEARIDFSTQVNGGGWLTTMSIRSDDGVYGTSFVGNGAAGQVHFYTPNGQIRSDYAGSGIVAQAGTVQSLDGFDRVSAGKLVVGPSTATSIAIGKAQAPTFISSPSSVPADGSLTVGQISISLNEAGNTILIKVKKSDGTVLNLVTPLALA